MWWRLWFVARVLAGVALPLLMAYCVKLMRPEQERLPVLVLIAFLVMYIGAFLESLKKGG